MFLVESCFCRTMKYFSRHNKNKGMNRLLFFFFSFDKCFQKILNIVENRRIVFLLLFCDYWTNGYFRWDSNVCITDWFFEKSHLNSVRIINAIIVQIVSIQFEIVAYMSHHNDITIKRPLCHCGITLNYVRVRILEEVWLMEN